MIKYLPCGTYLLAMLIQTVNLDASETVYLEASETVNLDALWMSLTLTPPINMIPSNS